MSSSDILLEPWPARRPATQTEPDITTALSGLTDRVIARRVVETMQRQGNPQPMNKFAELAARSAALRKSLDERADKIAKRLDAIPDAAESAFGKHEQMLDQTENGIRELEDSLRDLAGHNGPLPSSSGE
jgi:hypothetical protein